MGVTVTLEVEAVVVENYPEFRPQHSKSLATIKKVAGVSVHFGDGPGVGQEGFEPLPLVADSRLIPGVARGGRFPPGVDGFGIVSRNVEGHGVSLEKQASGVHANPAHGRAVTGQGWVALKRLTAPVLPRYFAFCIERHS